MFNDIAADQFEQPAACGAPHRHRAAWVRQLRRDLEIGAVVRAHHEVHPCRIRRAGALPVEDLLPQDVCVPAVLGEFAQYVEVHPAQRERAKPVAVDVVVQPQG